MEQKKQIEDEEPSQLDYNNPWSSLLKWIIIGWDGEEGNKKQAT